MMEGTKVLIYLLTFVAHFHFETSGETVISLEGCVLNIPRNRKFAPTYIDSKTRTQIMPQAKRHSGWFVQFEPEERVVVNCERNATTTTTTTVVQTTNDTLRGQTITCIRGRQFKTDLNEVLLLPTTYECPDPNLPTAVVVQNGTCYANRTNFDVRFIPDHPKRTFYSACVDERRSETLYVTSYIDGEGIADGLTETVGNRPQFRGHELYPFDIRTAYRWEFAELSLIEQIGSDDLVERYFPNQNFRFSRGHLFPNGDALLRYEKRATFFYINTVPQWQNLNGGNWATLEQDVRDLAKYYKRRFNVTTGAYGVTTLKDRNDNDVPIWLGRDNLGRRRLPVPKFVWKVVHDPVGEAAVAIVQINNPHVDTEGPRFQDDILCNDICSNLNWIRSQEFQTIRRGYTYCCDVQELREEIPYVPDLEYTNVLGSDYQNGGGEPDNDYDVDPFDPFENLDNLLENDLESGSSSESSSSSGSEEVVVKPGFRNLTTVTGLFANLTISDNNNSTKSL